MPRSFPPTTKWGVPTRCAKSHYGSLDAVVKPKRQSTQTGPDLDSTFCHGGSHGSYCDRHMCSSFLRMAPRAMPMHR